MLLSFSFFFFFAWSYYSLSHWISPSLYLFVLVFLSHLGWNVTLFHVWAVCIPSVFLSINYWAIKFTFPRGKTVVVNLSRRHSRAQVGRWDDGIVGDDVWIIQCWSYFETGVWQVIHHSKQLTQTTLQKVVSNTTIYKSSILCWSSVKRQ